MRPFMFTAAVFALFVFAPINSAATDTNSADPQTEERAKEIGRALRCVVCQNQSIEESDASLAEDMRRLVRARLASGDSNSEVIAYMQSRYGDFVLLKPPMKPSTYFLWFAPFIFAVIGGAWFLVQTRDRTAITASPPLTAEEVSRLEKLEQEQHDQG